MKGFLYECWSIVWRNLLFLSSCPANFNYILLSTFTRTYFRSLFLFAYLSLLITSPLAVVVVVVASVVACLLKVVSFDG